MWVLRQPSKAVKAEEAQAWKQQRAEPCCCHSQYQCCSFGVRSPSLLAMPGNLSAAVSGPVCVPVLSSLPALLPGTQVSEEVEALRLAHFFGNAPLVAQLCDSLARQLGDLGEAGVLQASL